MTAWGKLDRHAPHPKPRLSLVAHCVDVAAVLEAMLELPALRHRLDHLAGRALDDIDAQRLNVLAFLHDVGKAGAGFYSKALNPGQQLDRTQQSHTRAVAPLLCNPDARYDPLRDAIGLRQWIRWGTSVQQGVGLWLAAVSHHGQPITEQELQPLGGSFDTTWFTQIDGYRPLDGLVDLGRSARGLWPRAWDAASREYADALQHAFAGLVSVADWIASNPEAQDFFPFDLGPQDETRWALSRARAAHALRALGLDLRDAQSALRRRSPSFADLFDGRQPRPLQEAAATHLSHTLMVLEAETGSGKTEAALWRFKALFEAGRVDALCFLLPTRVAASGIYSRLQRFAEAAFPDVRDRPAFVLAVPSDLQANGLRGRRLPDGFQVLWPDDTDTPSARFWAAEHSKRYFAGGLVAGTIDQFLLSALRTSHAHLRASLSLRALVVVDEVHASDAYMGQLLRVALKRHAAAGGHALLLSATLTAQARRALLGCAPGATAATVGSAQDPYPSIAFGASIEPVAAHGRTKQVHLECLGAMLKPAAVVQRAMQSIDHGQRVLIVRNTVAQAIATQQALESQLGLQHPALFRCGAVVALHHGRYALADRRALDEAVQARFGLEAHARAAAAVLVGTQTLEISVDCDSDVLITDLAPIDVLLQRIGRLHRHPQRDPVRVEPMARCVLITPEQRDMTALLAPGGARGLGVGSRSAYPNLLMIEASWRLATDHPTWQLPLDNRRLVEAGCDPGALWELAQSLGAPWQTHLHEQSGRNAAQRAQALPAVVDWASPWESLSRGDLDGNARTRLGLDAIEVRLPMPHMTAFGHRIDALSVPAWMCPQAADDSPVTHQREDGEGLHFEWAQHRFTYGRWGLRRRD